MPEASYARLQALRTTTEAASYAEVVRNALRLFEWAVAQKQDGATFHITDAHGVQRELVLVGA